MFATVFFFCFGFDSSKPQTPKCPKKCPGIEKVEKAQLEQSRIMKKKLNFKGYGASQ